MLDIKFIKEHKEIVEEAIKNKKVPVKVDVTALLGKYDQYLTILKKVELHRSLRNNLSKDISKVSEEEKIKLMQEAKRTKDELVDMEKTLELLRLEVNDLVMQVPNIYASETPLSEDDSGNVVVRQMGAPKNFAFTPKDHVSLGESLDVIEIDKAGQVSGSRFYYLKGSLAFLQFALIQYVLNILTDEKVVNIVAQSVGNPSSKPFIPVVPPVFIKPEVMKRMDRLDPIEERYYIPSDDLVLVGSAEHTLGPLLMDETVNIEELPIRFVGYSTAFRREAGSYGKDVRGILRVHQFDKLEMESFSTVEGGENEQNLIVGLQEYIMSGLKIPYQVVLISTGDMGKPDFKQIDIECWMPGQNKYRETHTSDFMTDYQARRLNAGYKDKQGNRKYLYMNDATAIAIGRTLIAIMENYQNEDGSITVPEVLRKYTNFDIIKK
jgi:seryl-tRNA synthetase